MKNIFIFILVALFVIISNSVFTVDEREYALKFRFGEIIKSDYEPGIHFKFPFVNNVNKYPKRILTINNPQELFLTAEKKNLYVDFFIKWRIDSTTEYYRSTGGDELVAAQRLLENVKDGIRSEFAKRTVIEVVSKERRELMSGMLTDAATNARNIGIELVDVRVKRIELSDDVSESVYNRMRQERARIASELRAEGSEDATVIRATADRERIEILANANRDSQIIKGEGDAEAANLYATAYNEDREFYSFYRSLEAYKSTFNDKSNMILLKPDSDFFRYFNDTDGIKK